jgi:hypothetical protein
VPHIEEEMLSGARREADPPGHEDTKYMPVRKQSDIAGISADSGDHSINPRPHLLRYFAPRVDNGCVAETGQIAGLTCTPHRADENARERFSLEYRQ